ncbi:MAG: sensor histidine kinase, partial [Planctomycetota bacterium]
MRLLRKLILTFTILAFLPLLLMAGVLVGSQRQRLMDVGRENVANLAGDAAGRIDLLLERTVEQVHQLAISQRLVAELETANRQYSGLADDAVTEMLLGRDREWAQSADTASGIVKARLSSPAAEQLRLFQAVAPERYAEIILTDRAGGLHAATNLTSDYFQADEEWWQRTFASGRGSTFIGDIGYDSSAGVFSLDVAAPVRNGRREVIGVLKVVHDVNALFEAVSELRAGTTGHGDLVNSEGKSVFGPAGVPLSPQFGVEIMATVRSLGQGVVVEQLAPRHGKQVVGFAMLPSTAGAGKARVNGSPWFIMVAQPASEVYAPSRRALLWSIVVLLLPLAGLALLVAHLRRRLVQPIGALHWASEQMAAGHLDVRVQIGHGDEIEAVGYQFNRMAAALQRHEREQRTEIRRRTEELRQSDLQARRVRDAMSAQMNAISQGMRAALDEMCEPSERGLEVRENAELAAAARLTVGAFAEDLEDLCKVESGRMEVQPAQVRLGDLVGSARRVLTPLIRLHRARLEFPDESVDCLLVGDRAKLKQILYALVSNAVRYGGEEAVVTISAERVEEETLVAVRDSGPGIPPDQQEGMFDPLASGSTEFRSLEERAGLSLPIAKQLVEL